MFLSFTAKLQKQNLAISYILFSILFHFMKVTQS